jgi:hypothetical protein
MRSLIAITASVAMLVAQVPLVPAFGQTAPPAPQAAAQSQNSVVSATLNDFPNGGDALSARIADLIIANPKLATDFVTYIRNAQGLTREQKVAVEQGLAAAADRLGIKAQVVNGEDDGLWLLALAILAIAAGICIMACDNGKNNALFAQLVSPN